MREFVISFEIPNSVPVVVDERDTLGIIGEILSRVTQLDPGESMVIECVED